MNPDEPTETTRSGIVAVEAFQTSDGSIYLSHNAAKDHEAMAVLVETLQSHVDLTDRDVDKIIDNKGFITASLKTYYDSIQ